MENKGLKDLKNLFKSKEQIQRDEEKIKIEAFLADYRQLVMKHGYDVMPQLQIVKVQPPPTIMPVQSLPIMPPEPMKIK